MPSLGGGTWFAAGRGCGAVQRVAPYVRRVPPLARSRRHVAGEARREGGAGQAALPRARRLRGGRRRARRPGPHHPDLQPLLRQPLPQRAAAGAAAGAAAASACACASAGGTIARAAQPEQPGAALAPARSPLSMGAPPLRRGGQGHREGMRPTAAHRPPATRSVVPTCYLLPRSYRPPRATYRR